MKARNQERVIIERIQPCIDGGIFALKTIAQQPVIVSADILADGHDVLRAQLFFRKEKAKKWEKVDLKPTLNDRWEATMTAHEEGAHEYFLEAWVDWPLNWLYGTRKKIAAGQDVKSELLEGA
jgi:starch synthase (maltosyl-transferring)